MRSTLAQSTLAALALCGCGSNLELPTVQDSPNCDPTGGSIEIQTETRFGVVPTTGSIRVSGTARHPRGLTIRRILVGNVPATHSSFNFATWSAEISAEELARLSSLADGGVGETVAIPVVAYDVCDVGTPRGSATLNLQIQTAAQTRVRRLAVARVPDAQMPPGAAPLNAPVQLEVRTNLEASGVSVRASLDPGGSGATFADGSAQVTLTPTASETNDAVARFSLRGATATGTAVVTLIAGNQATALAVRFVGPPAMLPESPSIAPGQTVRVNVISDGLLHECALSPASSTAFTVDGIPATGRVELKTARADFGFTATSMPGPSLTLECRDTFGQSARAAIARTP